MMVIRGTIGTAANLHWPADKCAWSESYSNGNYEINDAFFYPGSVIQVGGETASGEHRITNPSLGYIGKSGRFVKIAN